MAEDEYCSFRRLNVFRLQRPSTPNHRSVKSVLLLLDDDRLRRVPLQLDFLRDIRVRRHRRQRSLYAPVVVFQLRIRRGQPARHFHLLETKYRRSGYALKLHSTVGTERKGQREGESKKKFHIAFSSLLRGKQIVRSSGCLIRKIANFIGPESFPFQRWWRTEC